MSIKTRIGLMMTMDSGWVVGVGRVSGLYYREERGVMNRARHLPGSCDTQQYTNICVLVKYSETQTHAFKLKIDIT